MFIAHLFFCLCDCHYFVLGCLFYLSLEGFVYPENQSFVINGTKNLYNLPPFKRNYGIFMIWKLQILMLPNH
jgi:hypothetical protein